MRAVIKYGCANNSFHVRAEREYSVLMAYDDCGFKIKDTPTEESRVSAHPIKNIGDAKRILAEAKRQRPEIQWAIKGTGPYGVYGQAQ